MVEVSVLVDKKKKKDLMRRLVVVLLEYHVGKVKIVEEYCFDWRQFVEMNKY